MKQILKQADEYDVLVGRLRHMLCYTQRAGVCSAVKRRVRRRARREAKDTIRRGDD